MKMNKMINQKKLEARMKNRKQPCNLTVQMLKDLRIRY